MVVFDKNRSEGQSLGKVCDRHLCDLSMATEDSAGTLPVNCYETKPDDPKPVAGFRKTCTDGRRDFFWSWWVRSTPERAVRVQALARDIVLCSWARHCTLTMPLSTQVYKWVPVNCWENLTNCGGVTCDGLASRPWGVEILLTAPVTLSQSAPRLHTHHIVNFCS